MSYALPPTPPPWVPAVLPDGTWIVRRDDKTVACAPGGEANARLIAAAPEMLAALQTTAENLRSWMAANSGVRTFDGWLECVDAAIAKATGGQQ